jgi:glutamate--cysteine ligase
VAEPSDDPAEAYVRFAAGAGEILGGDWDTHLTTLFPEVRPRGHYEVRSCDAIDPRWYAAPIVFISALAYDEVAAKDAALLAADSRALLRAAGQRGLHDSSIARTARDLFQLALDGARRLGPSFIDDETLAAAAEFYSRYTARDRAPADDANRSRIFTVRSRSSRV